MTSPTLLTLVSAADLTRLMCGACADGTDASSVSLTFGPEGGVPVAVATFVTTPASRSPCVIVWLPVHDRDAPGASVAGCGGVHVNVPSFGSTIVTLVSVTLPSFVATS